MAKHDSFAALVAKNAKKAAQRYEQQKKAEELKKKLIEEVGTTLDCVGPQNGVGKTSSEQIR